MTVQFQVVSVQKHADGTASVWLRWVIGEPGTGYFPHFPATCTHQNVSVGDWWQLELSEVQQP